MNMFISILNDVLVEVHNDTKLQNNDYEMVDYMVDSIKSKSLRYGCQPLSLYHFNFKTMTATLFIYLFIFFKK